MRVSRLMLVTLRDDPAEAEIPSHKLLLRAGYMRRVASGIYAYLPLLWRVLQKVSLIVRQEMDRTDTAPTPEFTKRLALDLGSIVPSLAGPKRPQDRVPLVQVQKAFAESLT
ncbi:MAG: aconitase family protein, partial [Cyanobium sp. LacPavin_0920_WC12_MAG_62_9]|nr:aconitase family protein [Cyanobium sp. LacPavin_0920_WC12_MAG_62_9]